MNLRTCMFNSFSTIFLRFEKPCSFFSRTFLSCKQTCKKIHFPARFYSGYFEERKGLWCLKRWFILILDAMYSIFLRRDVWEGCCFRKFLICCHFCPSHSRQQMQTAPTSIILLKCGIFLLYNCVNSVLYNCVYSGVWCMFHRLLPAVGGTRVAGRFGSDRDIFVCGFLKNQPG